MSCLSAIFSMFSQNYFLTRSSVATPTTNLSPASFHAKHVIRLSLESSKKIENHELKINENERTCLTALPSKWKCLLQGGTPATWEVRSTGPLPRAWGSMPGLKKIRIFHSSLIFLQFSNVMNEEIKIIERFSITSPFVCFTEAKIKSDFSPERLHKPSTFWSSSTRGSARAGQDRTLRESLLKTATKIDALFSQTLPRMWKMRSFLENKRQKKDLSTGRSTRIIRATVSRLKSIYTCTAHVSM